jgi:hypothetical protein
MKFSSDSLVLTPVLPCRHRSLRTNPLLNAPRLAIKLTPVPLTSYHLQRQAAKYVWRIVMHPLTFLALIVLLSIINVAGYPLDQDDLAPQ